MDRLLSSNTFRLAAVSIFLGNSELPASEQPGMISVRINTPPAQPHRAPRSRFAGHRGRWFAPTRARPAAAPLRASRRSGKYVVMPVARKLWQLMRVAMPAAAASYRLKPASGSENSRTPRRERIMEKPPSSMKLVEVLLSSVCSPGVYHARSLSRLLKSPVQEPRQFLVNVRPRLGVPLVARAYDAGPVGVARAPLERGIGEHHVRP
jgi:hypothetical protein